MRVEIKLADIDASQNNYGYNMVMLYLFKNESAISKCKDGTNVIFYGKTQEIPESILEVIIGEEGNTVMGENKELVICNQTKSAKESVDFIIDHYPEHKYCIIMKEKQ